MKSLTSLLLVMVLSALSVQAQPTPQTIVNRAQAAYAEAFSGVDSYLITTTMMGFSTTTYAERIPGGGPLDFETYVVGPDGGLMAQDDATMELMAGDMLANIGDKGRYVGEHQINGETAHGVEVTDMDGLMDQSQLPDGDEFEIESATFYFSANTGFLVGFDASGATRNAGQAEVMNMSMRFSDYRRTSGLTWPHLMTIRIEGVGGTMSADEMAELEALRQQLADMPAEQRRMMESIMGDQLAQFDAMLAGEGLEFEAVVTDVQVNVPRP